MELFTGFDNIGHYMAYSVDELDEDDPFLKRFWSFFKNVVPRIAEVQDPPDCLNLVYIKGITSCVSRGLNEELIFNECEGHTKEMCVILSGLEPLINSLLINSREAKRILKWFDEAPINIERKGEFLKHIMIEEDKYTLYTCSGKQVRRLCLAVGHIHF